MSEQYQARCMLLLKDILLYRLGSDEYVIVNADNCLFAKKICDYVEEMLEIYQVLFPEECDVDVRKTIRTWLYYEVLNENKI